MIKINQMASVIEARNRLITNYTKTLEDSEFSLLPFNIIYKLENDINSIDWGTLTDKKKKAEMMRQKLGHMYNMANIMLEKSRKKQKNIVLYITIGLLHDYGRIKEISSFGNFHDKGFNHAEEGVKALFNNGIGSKISYIRNFGCPIEWDETIYYAIKYHSVLNLDDSIKSDKVSLSKEDYQICLDTRNADKQDIMVFLLQEPTKVTCSGSTEKELGAMDIYEDAYVECITCIPVNRKNPLYDNMGNFLSHIGFLFDPSNSKELLEWIKRTNWVNKYIDKVQYTNPETKRKMEVIRQTALNFLNRN